MRLVQSQDFVHSSPIFLAQDRELTGRTIKPCHDHAIDRLHVQSASSGTAPFPDFEIAQASPPGIYAIPTHMAAAETHDHKVARAVGGEPLKGLMSKAIPGDPFVTMERRTPGPRALRQQARLPMLLGHWSVARVRPGVPISCSSLPR
ncbi:hypothetical protein GCM10010324_07060 [Streptomyces hiroshimensis]|uniref:Uncharacterized protein n=1 Tax=Streptomyces hiroshimensis TaxID=66424 RepID=A0ABQ2Y4L9_9ACTN|nr:hypothetical protein GCM10010324_07060 [Streptomyces hiroshimensis]